MADELFNKWAAPEADFSAPATTVQPTKDDLFSKWAKPSIAPVLEQAMEQDPDKTARVQKLAGLTGINPRVIEEDFDQFSRKLAADELDNRLNKAPITKSVVSDPDVAAVAHDDLNNLIDNEQLVSKHLSTEDALARIFDDPITDVVRAIGAGLLQIPIAVEQITGAIEDVTGAGQLKDPITGVTAKESHDQSLAAWKALQAKVLGPQKNLPDWLSGGAQSAGSTLAAIATANPLTTMGATAGGQSYEQAREAGQPAWLSAIYGIEQGAVEAITEKLPLENLLKGLKEGSPLLELLGKQFVLENVTEQIATAWQDFNEWLTLRPDKTAEDYLAERPNAAFQTFLATTTAVVLQTTASHMLMNQGAQDQQKVKAAEATQDFLDQWKKTYDLSMLRERAPEVFVQHQMKVLEKSGVDQVYIDADGFAEYGWRTDSEKGPDALAEQFGLDKEKVNDAILLGHDITLTREQFVRGVMMSQDYADISPHVRFKPEHMTKAEAEQYKKTGIKEEAEAALAAKAPVEGAGITVFHGTQHDLVEFSREGTAKTGEGTEMMGAGIYVAEERKVAQTYRDNTQFVIGPLSRDGKTVFGVWNKAGHKYGEFESEAQARSALNIPEGNLFESKLYLKHDDVLNLDDKIKDQPQKIRDIAANADFNVDSSFTGEDFYRFLAKNLGSNEAASDYLASVGIRAGKFLDQQSRARGYGTSNYVVYDTNALVIQKKNDVLIEEAIALAEAELGLQGLFVSANEAGLSNAEFNIYLRKVEAAKEASIQKQKDKVLKEELKKNSEEYAKARDEIEAQVKEELSNLPVYQAVNNIGKERLDGAAIRATFHELVENKQITKEDIDAFMEMLPEQAKGRKIYTTQKGEKGIDPQVWAEVHGYESAIDMLQDMMTSPAFKDAVKIKTDKILGQRYGDLLDARQRLIEARESLHNEDKGDMLTFELNALRGAKKGKRLKPVLVRQAAREAMLKIQVKDISPNKFLAAEKREGRKAGLLLRKGTYNKETKKWSKSDRAGAAQAKFRQVLNFFMAKEAYKAEKKLAKDLKYLKKFLNRRKKFADLPGDSLDVIREILSEYRLGPKLTAAKKRNLIEWATKASAITGVPLTIPARVAAEDTQKYYKDLTLDEFNELVETIRNIDHSGRTEGRFLNAQRAQGVAATAIQVGELVKQNLTFKEQLRESRLQKTSKLDSYITAISNADTILQEIDGGQLLGKAYDAIKRPYDRAMSEGYHPGQVGFSQRDNDNAKALKQLFSVFTQKERAHMDDPLTIPGVRGSLSHAGVLSVLLNSGTSANLKALVEPSATAPGQFTMAEIRAIHQYASEKDWDFAQSVWDYLDSFWPEIEAAERRRKGYAPEKVEATPIRVTHRSKTGGTVQRTMRGGYYPLRYDGDVQDVQSKGEIDRFVEQARFGNFVASHTRRGHTVERVGSGGRRLKLDLHVLFSHTHQVLYDLEVGDAINDIYRVLYHPQLTQAFVDQGQKHKHDELKLWFGDVVTGEIRLNDNIERIFRWLRTGFTTSKLAFNIANALVQPVGLVNTAALVGKRNTLKAVLNTTMLNPHRQFGKNSVYQEVLSKSGFMRNRDHTWHKDINDALSQLSTTWVAKHTPEQLRNLGRISAFYFTQKAQRFADVVAWQAGYSKAKKLGMNEAKAIEYADRTVARSQGSSIFGERTRFERGTFNKNHRQTELARSFTAMASYFVAQTNVTIARTKQLKSVRYAAMHPLTLANYIVDMAMVYWMGALLAGWWYWPDDEEKTGEWMVGQTLSNFANGLPFVREVSSAVSGYDTGGVVGAVAGSAGDAIVQLSQIAKHGPDQIDTKLFVSLNNLAGILFHYPASQINRFARAYEKAESGERTEPQEFIMGPKR